MIENEGTGGTRLYCRWCAVGCCYEHADTRCGGWQAMKPLAAAQFRGYDSNLICSMSHRDHPPPPETNHFTFRLLRFCLTGQSRPFTLILPSLNSSGATASIRSFLTPSPTSANCELHLKSAFLLLVHPSHRFSDVHTRPAFELDEFDRNAENNL